MEPELDDQRAVLGQRALQRVDAGEFGGVTALADVAQRARHDRLRVPGAEQDRDLAAELVGEALDDDRHPGDLVAAVAERELVVGHRRADEADGVAALRLGDAGPQPDRDQRPAIAREQVAELRLRRGAGLRLVEDDRGDELGVVDREALKDRRRAEAGREELAEGLLLLLRSGVAERADLLHDRLVRAGRRLVDEGGRPEHDPGRPEVGDLPADVGRVLTARVGTAGEAGLEPEQPVDVRRQHQLLEVALDEDDDRVVAEAVVELLGALERRRAVVDELVGPGVGRQPQRADDGDDRDDRNGRSDRRGRMGHRPLS